MPREEKDMTNTKVFRFLSVENVVMLLLIFASVVATWTTYGHEIRSVQEEDDAQNEKIEKIKLGQAEIKEAVTETKLDVREIKANQEHVNRDVQRILMILEDNRNR